MVYSIIIEITIIWNNDYFTLQSRIAYVEQMYISFSV